MSSSWRGSWLNFVYDVAMTYDPTRLQQLGRRHKKLRAQLEELQKELAEEIVAADRSGELKQVKIAEMTGFTRESVRVFCLTPEQKEEELQRRRLRTRKSTT